MFWSTPMTFVNARVVTPGGRLARTIRIRGGRVDGIDVAPGKRDAVIDSLLELDGVRDVRVNE